MEDTTALAIGALTLLALLPLLRIWAWCLSDLLGHQAELDPRARTLWLALLVFGSLLGILAYTGIGPGSDRWDPDMLWWPWKR